MLAHILALTVGLLSFALYMSAFFFPEAYRKSDLTWSGIGLFYALVLWVCAGRITGGVLLGQTASVALLGWLGWQTINLRRELAPIALRTPLPNEAKTIGQAAQFKLGELKSRWQQTKLADQTNRLAGTIAGWTSSIAKPKQPPSVGSRRKSKKPKPPASIEPAAITESVVNEPIAEESVIEATMSESAIDQAAAAVERTAVERTAVERTAVEPPTAEPPIVRPARSPGLFGGFRRNKPKAKAPKAPKTKPPKPLPTPPPEPDLDLEEFENWEDEETIEPVPPPEETIEEVVVIESAEGAIEDVVIVVESEEGAIEEVIVVETEEGAIEEVVVVVETDDSPSIDPPSNEMIEVVAIEQTLPTDDAIEVAIEPADSAFVEAERSPDSSPEGDEWIEPEPPALEID